MAGSTAVIQGRGRNNAGESGDTPELLLHCLPLKDGVMPFSKQTRQTHQ